MESSIVLRQMLIWSWFMSLINELHLVADLKVYAHRIRVHDNFYEHCGAFTALHFRYTVFIHLWWPHHQMGGPWATWSRYPIHIKKLSKYTEWVVVSWCRFAQLNWSFVKEKKFVLVLYCFILFGDKIRLD